MSSLSLPTCRLVIKFSNWAITRAAAASPPTQSPQMTWVITNRNGEFTTSASTPSVRGHHTSSKPHEMSTDGDETRAVSATSAAFRPRTAAPPRSLKWQRGVCGAAAAATSPAPFSGSPTVTSHGVVQPARSLRTSQTRRPPSSSAAARPERPGLFGSHSGSFVSFAGRSEWDAGTAAARPGPVRLV